MKTFLAACLAAALTTLAGAQVGAQTGAETPVQAPEQSASTIARPRSIDAERARISEERSRLEAGFAKEDVACYQKFFVNSCRGDVTARRREAVADLRRQEISLNDEERRIKGAEQIRKTEEKSSPENQQQAADRRARALEDYQSRIEREKQKQQAQAAAQAGEKASREASAEKLKGNQQKAVARSDKQAKAAEESKKFNGRQKEAQERRLQHDKGQLNRVKPPAKSLPIPQ